MEIYWALNRKYDFLEIVPNLELKEKCPVCPEQSVNLSYSPCGL